MGKVKVIRSFADASGIGLALCERVRPPPQRKNYKGLLSESPWREVVHIEERTGPRGGSGWLLTLACGHTASRPDPTPRDPMRFLTAMQQNDLRGAPKKLRCITCWAVKKREAS